MKEIHSIRRCEAQLVNYYGSGLIHSVAATERDALHLYHALKFLSFEEGHTFVLRPRLELEAAKFYQYFKTGDVGCGANPRGNKGALLRDMKPTAIRAEFKKPSSEWGPALEFLRKWNVVVVETSGACPHEKVYITSLWEAEQNIAHTFQRLLHKHKISPWTFTIDPNKYVDLFLFYTLHVS